MLAKGAAPDSSGFPAAVITVSELERMVNGGAHRPLFEIHLVMKSRKETHKGS